MEKQSKWAIAGKEALSGNFGNAYKALSSLSIKHDVRGPQGMFAFGVGSSQSYFTWSDSQSALDAYKRCPEFQAIVNKRATAHSNGKRWIMNIKGKGKEKESQSEFANKCRNLLENPNPSETGQLFEARLKIYLDVFGWVCILPIFPRGFEKAPLCDADYLFLIPPYMLTWTETGAWRNQKGLRGLIKELILDVSGERTYLDLDQVVIIKDIVPRMFSDYGIGGMAETLVFPESRVQAQAKPINNIIGAYASRGELISFAGAQGLISPPEGGQFVAMALTPDEENSLQAKFKMQYGISAGQYRNIISPQPIKYQQIGRPTKDLMLFEEVQDDTRALCSAWPYPYKLLGGNGVSSLNGTEVDALMAGWYQNDIIPEACGIEAQLAKAFKASENGVRFDKDFNHVSALQEDEKEKALAFNTKVIGVQMAFQSGFISFNRSLEMLGEDTVADGEIYYDEWSKLHGTPQNNTNGQQQGQEAGTEAASQSGQEAAGAGEGD